jgi:hypothetical protein
MCFLTVGMSRMRIFAPVEVAKHLPGLGACLENFMNELFFMNDFFFMNELSYMYVLFFMN